MKRRNSAKKNKENKQEEQLKSEKLQDMFYEYVNIVSPYTKLLVYYDNYSMRTKRYVEMFKELERNLKESEEIKQIRMELSIETKYKYKNMIKELVNDYPYVLKNYLMKHKLININISNAFTKLYEMLYMHMRHIFKNNRPLKVYHMAEAPGQWIKCIEFFIKNNGINVNYDWYANTLNPNNEENKRKYNIIFDDKYGLMKENIKKWLYGEDNTGDIMNVKNIINIKEELNKNEFVPDLITSDAGIDIKENDVIFLQKLDYAQLINVIILSKKNTNIIIKTFLPYIMNKKETLSNESVGFFISLMYLYVKLFEHIYFYKPMTSGVTTGEFYIIGIKYKNNITEELKDTLIYKLEKFELNNEIVPHDLIPNYIKYQIFSYLNDILILNNTYIKLEIDFIKIIKDNIITDEFLKILNDIKAKKINYWLYRFDFFSEFEYDA